MTEQRELHITPRVAVVTVLAVLLVGGGGTYLLMRGDVLAPRGQSVASGSGAGANGVMPPTASSPALDESPEPLPDVTVTLTKEAVDRAGIRVTEVSTRVATESLRLPGVVEPNAYRQVSVTSLVGGRVVRVLAQLGDRVKRDQSLAQVYSPELADARTTYVAAKAMLEAHERELQRTQKLVEIGAASRQEMERLHAEHAAQTAEVESARSRLQLLGADTQETSHATEGATANVQAPIDGVVTERLANVGLNVDPTTKLFTVLDLSNVWVVADVYERDLHRVRHGALASVTMTAYPDRRLEGRVSYIDPQLNPTTRTAKVRVEVANPHADLRLGMYADVSIESASVAPVLVVPKAAIQNVGERQMVYLSRSNDAGKFVEREVRVGRTLGDRVEVLAGLSAGDSVVSNGSFFVRAEAERLGLRNNEH